uniref:Uncharacterized protein n=1 Tax=Ditylenchus dipsaci TaxID=166011 RepID=A0A915D6X2_9BILA
MQQQSDAAEHGYSIFRAYDGEKIYHIPYKYPQFYEFDYWSPVWVHSMFDRYWHFSLGIVAFYVLGVYVLRR